MKFAIRCHPLNLVTALFLCMSFAAQAAEPDFAEIIKYRKSIMKSQREHMAAASGIIHGKVEFKEQLTDHVRALEATTKVIYSLFPAGSNTGDTGALEGVWANSAEFEKRAADTREKSAALVKAVVAGEELRYGSRLTELLDSCKACHKEFRKTDQR